MKPKLIFPWPLILVVAGLAACQNNGFSDNPYAKQWFPNKVGDSWTYAVNDDTASTLQISIIGSSNLSDGTPVMIWQNVWPPKTFRSSYYTDTTYVAISGDSVLISDGLVYSSTCQCKKLSVAKIYIFPLQSGKSWRLGPDSSRVVSEDSLTVPAGTFGEVYHIHTTGSEHNYSLDQNIWFKRGVGIIQKYQKRFYGGFYGTLKLVDYHVK